MRVARPLRVLSHRPCCAVMQPRATRSFYTAIDCHWLSFLRDLHTNLAAIAVILSQNHSVAPGYCDVTVAARAHQSEE